MKVATFDLEARENPSVCGWKNYHAIGISYGCIHSDVDDSMTIFGEDDLQLCIDKMRDADVITGFNINGFDWPLLAATLAKKEVIVNDWAELMAKTYDPFEDIKRATGQFIPKGWNLKNVSESNITVLKKGDGAQAPTLWKEDKHDELKSYVTQDVLVERELFLYCREKKILRNKFVTKNQIIRLDNMVKLCLLHKWSGVPA